jgi:hypothetical protein
VIDLPERPCFLLEKSAHGAPLASSTTTTINKVSFKSY